MLDGTRFSRPNACNAPVRSFRGAYNAVAMLDDDVKCVVAWSSGNHTGRFSNSGDTRYARHYRHAQMRLGKIEGTKALGGEVVTYDRYNESREDIGTSIAAENNAAIIPPFDYAPVIAGQGTIGAEVGEEPQRHHPISWSAVLAAVGFWPVFQSAFTITSPKQISSPQSRRILMISADRKAERSAGLPRKHGQSVIRS